MFLEKLACNVCINENEDLLVKTVTELDLQRSLVEFLLKIVLNIQLLSARFCEKLTDHCNVCRLYLIYKGKGFRIYKNLLNLDFLEHFAQKVASDLQIIRKENAHLLCNLNNRKIFYNHCDWFSGEIESYSISRALDIYENDKIDEIKNSNFKIVIVIFFFRKNG